MFLLLRGCAFAHGPISRGTICVNLTSHELVKLFEHLLLRLRELVLLLVEPNRVGLAAGLKEVPLVIVLSAPAPAAVHQLLVVRDGHLGRGDSPRFVTFWLLVAFAVAARVGAMLTCVAPAHV